MRVLERLGSRLVHRGECYGHRALAWWWQHAYVPIQGTLWVARLNKNSIVRFHCVEIFPSKCMY